MDPVLKSLVYVMLTVKRMRIFDSNWLGNYYIALFKIFKEILILLILIYNEVVGMEKFLAGLKLWDRKMKCLTKRTDI